jgi:hypothetical protein
MAIFALERTSRTIDGLPPLDGQTMARCPNGVTSPPKCGPGTAAACPSSTRSRRNSSTWPQVTASSCCHCPPRSSTPARASPTATLATSRPTRCAWRGTPPGAAGSSRTSPPSPRATRQWPAGPRLTLRAADASLDLGSGQDPAGAAGPFPVRPDPLLPEDRPFPDKLQGPSGTCTLAAWDGLAPDYLAVTVHGWHASVGSGQHGSGIGSIWRTT